MGLRTWACACTVSADSSALLAPGSTLSSPCCKLCSTKSRRPCEEKLFSLRKDVALEQRSTPPNTVAQGCFGNRNASTRYTRLHFDQFFDFRKLLHAAAITATVGDPPHPRLAEEKSWPRDFFSDFRFSAVSTVPLCSRVARASAIEGLHFAQTVR